MSVRPELSALIKAERPDRSGGPIVYQTDLVQIRHQAMRDGMRTLRLSGAQKVAAGLTTVEEVMRVAPALDRFS